MCKVYLGLFVKSMKLVWVSRKTLITDKENHLSILKELFVSLTIESRYNHVLKEALGNRSKFLFLRIKII